MRDATLVYRGPATLPLATVADLCRLVSSEEKSRLGVSPRSVEQRVAFVSVESALSCRGRDYHGTLCGDSFDIEARKCSQNEDGALHINSPLIDPSVFCGSMLMLDKTTERLRSKHVRTLELLQKTLDENVDLRDRVSQLQEGSLHLSSHEPPPARLSNRVNELEDEIDRQRADHHAKLLASEETARLRQCELHETIESLHSKQQKLENDVFTLETRLSIARETLQTERTQWHHERQQFLYDYSVLQHQLEQTATNHKAAENNQKDSHSLEWEALQKELESHRRRHVESQELHEQLHSQLAALATEINQQNEKLAGQQRDLDSANQRIQEAMWKEQQLMEELTISKAQIQELQTNINSLGNGETNQQIQQQQKQEHAVILGQLRQMEADNGRLVCENRSLQEALSKLQVQFKELTKATSTVSNNSVFATHIDLKRENFHLRAQIEEMKQLQKRFLTTGHKKTMKFPAI